MRAVAKEEARAGGPPVHQTCVYFAWEAQCEKARAMKSTVSTLLCKYLQVRRGQQTGLGELQEQGLRQGKGRRDRPAGWPGQEQQVQPGGAWLQAATGHQEHNRREVMWHGHSSTGLILQTLMVYTTTVTTTIHSFLVTEWCRERLWLEAAGA